jgi:DNA end-binding protein Ku
MVELASHILDSKAGKFDPSKFKDEYERALKKLVKRKAAGHTIEPSAPPEDRGNVINLMDALKKSMKGRKPTAKRAKTKSRKRA